MRTRGKDGFRGALDGRGAAVALPARRADCPHRPRSAEGRARLVHAAKPLVNADPERRFPRPGPARACRARAARRIRSGIAVRVIATGAPHAARVRAARSRAHRRCGGSCCAFAGRPGARSRRDARAAGLLGATTDFAPVAALVDYVQASGLTTTGALLEAARRLRHEALYGEVARKESRARATSRRRGSSWRACSQSSRRAGSSSSITDLVSKSDRTDVELERRTSLADAWLNSKARLRSEAFPELGGARRLGLDARNREATPG